MEGGIMAPCCGARVAGLPARRRKKTPTGKSPEVRYRTQPNQGFGSCAAGIFLLSDRDPHHARCDSGVPRNAVRDHVVDSTENIPSPAANTLSPTGNTWSLPATLPLPI